MIPTYSEYAKKESYKSKTYFISGNKISGFIDEIEAVKQAVLLILNTERYEHIIYSRNYGVELKGVFGKPMPLASSEVKRRIEEALLADDRILSIQNFSFRAKGDVLKTSFTVKSKFGEFDIEKAVAV